jgi:hypothetical protein
MTDVVDLLEAPFDRFIHVLMEYPEERRVRVFEGELGRRGQHWDRLNKAIVPFKKKSGGLHRRSFTGSNSASAASENVRPWHLGNLHRSQKALLDLFPAEWCRATAAIL